MSYCSSVAEVLLTGEDAPPGRLLGPQARLHVPLPRRSRTGTRQTVRQNPLAAAKPSRGPLQLVCLRDRSACILLHELTVPMPFEGSKQCCNVCTTPYLLAVYHRTSCRSLTRAVQGGGERLTRGRGCLITVSAVDVRYWRLASFEEGLHRNLLASASSEMVLCWHAR